MAETSRNPVFGINDFNQPKIQSPKESIINDILMILFGKPGFYPSIPTLGIDISKYLYEFEDEISTDLLKDELSEQCSELVEGLQTGDIDIVITEYKGNAMLIFVLPIIDDNKQVQLALGVTTNESGQIVYNFTESDPQII